MRITCWGARGSIPVSGRQYLKYGGDTTCMEIRTKDDKIIIVDAGSGIRRLGNKLLEEGRQSYNLIFTHAHWDHLLGFPFFKPIYIKGTEIKMFGCPFARESIKRMISKTMSPPNFPVNFDDVSAQISYGLACDKEFQIESVRVVPILLSHPNQGIGYKFIEDGSSFVFLTDNELTYQHPGGLTFGDYLEFSVDADLLIHDSEFTQEEYKRTKTWGHSVYTDALDLALKAGVKRFGLFHHNQERSDNGVDEIVGKCQDIIAQRNSALKCFALYSGMEIELGD